MCHLVSNIFRLWWLRFYSLELGKEMRPTEFTPPKMDVTTSRGPASITLPVTLVLLLTSLVFFSCAFTWAALLAASVAAGIYLFHLFVLWEFIFTIFVFHLQRLNNDNSLQLLHLLFLGELFLEVIAITRILCLPECNIKENGNNLKLVNVFKFLGIPVTTNISFIMKLNV